MSIPEPKISEYFPRTGEAKKWRILPKMSRTKLRKKIATGGCVDHLFRQHRTKFEELEAEGVIIARESTTTEERNNPKEDLAVRSCEFCRLFYENRRLGEHKSRQSYIRYSFGCEKYNEFYQLEPSTEPIFARGYARELADALINASEPTTAEIDNMKRAALATPKDANSSKYDNQQGAVYILVTEQWMHNTNEWDPVAAAEAWTYTGYSTNEKRRQSGHKTMTKLVVDKHDIDPSTLKSTIPLLVIKDIPALLAAAVEQALIVSRRKGIAKNKDNPYQKKIEEVSSKDLRHFAAKALVSALKKKEQIEIETTSTPTTTRKSSSSSLHQQPSTSGTSSLHQQPSTSGTSSLHQQPSTSGTSSLHQQPSTSGTSSLHQQPSTSGTSSLQQQPATSATPSSRTLSASTSNISKRRRVKSPAPLTIGQPLCTSTPNLPSTSNVPSTPSSAFGQCTLSSASSSTSFSFPTMCPHCQIGFVNPVLFEEHQQLFHTVENPLLCRRCSQPFQNGDDFYRHIMRQQCHLPQ